MEASQVLDVRTHLLVLLGGDAGLRAMRRDSVRGAGSSARRSDWGGSSDQHRRDEGIFDVQEIHAAAATARETTFADTGEPSRTFK